LLSKWEDTKLGRQHLLLPLPNYFDDWDHSCTSIDLVLNERRVNTDQLLINAISLLAREDDKLRFKGLFSRLERNIGMS